MLDNSTLEQKFGRFRRQSNWFLVVSTDRLMPIYKTSEISWRATSVIRQPLMLLSSILLC